MDNKQRGFSFPTRDQLRFQLPPASEPNSTRKYAEPWVGKALLLLSVLGGSSLGVIANQLPAEGPLLLSAWRFQALLFVSLFLVPFYYMYDRYYLRYQRYRVFLEQLQEKQRAKKQQQKSNDSDIKVEKEDMLTRKTYEEKYPRDTEESRTEAPLTKEQTLKQFEEQDVNGFRATLNKTIQSFNASVTLAAQTNLGLFDLEVIFGRRTFVRNLYFMTFLAAFFFCCWSGIMMWGAKNTVQSHVYSLCNLHGVLLIPLMMATGRGVHQMEKVGLLIVLVACLGIIFDQWSYRRDKTIVFPGKKYEHHVSNLGTDFLMLASNVPALLYFAFSRSLMRNRIMTHVLMTNFLITLIFSVGAILNEDAKMNIDRHKGLFGWLSADVAFTSIFFFGFFATFFGSVGYLLSMQFYSPITCMNAYLLEPFIAQILGLLFGIDKFPGTVTIIGVIAVAFGTVVANKGSHVMLREGRRVIPKVEGSFTGASGNVGHADVEAANPAVSGSEEEMSHLQMLQEKVKLMKMSKESLEHQIERKQLLGKGLNKNSEDVSAGLQQRTKASDEKVAPSSRQGGHTFSRILNPSLYE